MNWASPLVFLWLIGCVPIQEPRLLDTAAVSEPDPGVVQWSIQPTSLALGDTPVDLPLQASIALINTGDQDLQVFDLLGASEDKLEVSLQEACVLVPGATTSFDVVWTPDEPGTLASALSFAVGVSADEAQPVTVPVSGTALGPAATISTSSYDFGDVGVGCADDLLVTLTNTGNATMQVDAVNLQRAEGFVRYMPTDLPWVLEPFESHDQRVGFEPEEPGWVSSELSFETDAGVVGTQLQGTGVVGEERTLTFDIGEQAVSTIIVDVNNTAIPGSSEDQFSGLLVASLPTFFQTLLDNNATFRAGFVWATTGVVDGRQDYIDETFTAAEATEAALLMLSRGDRGGDNDANFITLLAAIDTNSDWLFEDEEWADSRLNLITIQRDMEQSGGYWSSWVSDARAFKDDDEDVVFHAIAGPVPSGCSGAEPFVDYDQAVAETGGVFLSICASDWTSHMTELAVACIDGPDGIFQLEGTPIDYSIEVTVDGVTLTEGWSYDEDSNAVVMDEESRPGFGSTVTIYFWTTDTCG